MKRKKEILAEYEKYKGDAIKNHDYGSVNPMSEWAMNRDIGFKNALEWVLELEEKQSNG